MGKLDYVVGRGLKGAWRPEWGVFKWCSVLRSLWPFNFLFLKLFKVLADFSTLKLDSNRPNLKFFPFWRAFWQKNVKFQRSFQFSPSDLLSKVPLKRSISFSWDFTFLISFASSFFVVFAFFILFSVLWRWKEGGKKVFFKKKSKTCFLCSSLLFRSFFSCLFHS